MSYIGVPENFQVTFYNLVNQSQKNFSDYSYPTSPETYWATVDYYWPQIKNIVLMFTLLDENELDKLVKERSPEIGSVFNNAWFKAPDAGRIHLIPAWHIFCDLCSESYLLYEPQ
jgi:hypothetical protein